MRPSSLERRLVQLGAALSLSASALALDPAKSLFQYNCQNWHRHEGLPVDRINAITQTRDGYLWLASQKGLFRYDGSEFRPLSFNSGKQFRNENVTCLARDPRGGFWFGLAGGSLCFSDGLALRPPPAHRWVDATMNTLAIAVSIDGAMWIGCDKGAIRLLEDNPDASTVFDDLGNCSALFKDAQSRCWLGTVQHGLFYWQDGKLTPFADESLKKNIIFAIAEDQQHRLWVATETGPRCYEPDFTATQIPETHTEVRALLVDRQGIVWMGTTGGGLLRFQHGAFDSFTKADGLADDTVTSLFEDQEGSLWIGTANGLSQLSNVKFPLLTSKEGLPDNACHAVAPAKDGSLWVTTSRGLSSIQGSRVTNFSADAGFTNPYLKRVFEARDGRVYVVDGQKNLLIFSSNKVVATFANTNWPVALGEDNAGVVVSVGGELFRVDSTGLTPCVFKNGRPQMYWIYGISTGRDASLWLATANGIVHVQNDEFEQWTFPQGASNNRINCLCEDDEGTIWAGLPAGIARLKNGQLQNISSDDALLDNTVDAIVPDHLGNLWVQSARGILRINRRDLNRYADGQARQLGCVLYDGLEALKTVDTSDIECSGCKTPDGRIWFPTPRGIVMIDPPNVFTNYCPPSVTIQRIRVDGQERKQADLSNLRPGARELQFDYAALTYIAPQKVLFRYQLEGYENDWIDAGTRRSAFYTNLKPGTYVFRLQACNADGIWSTRGESCELELPALFYETLWFKLVIAGAGLVFVGAIYAWRLSRHEATQLKLQAANEALEFRVRARTSDLAKANDALRKEIEAHRTAQASLEAIQKQLIETSRQAGMAEVATSILHNVGNVLNSVNVSAGLMQKTARASKAAGVARIAALLRENEQDLPAFLGSEKGKQLLPYLDGLGKQLAAEQNQLLEELAGLARNIDHIKQVVAMQQSYARVSGVLEQVDVKELVEDALRMQKESFERRGIQVTRDLQDLPPVELDRHRVLSILVNLLSNARHACDSAGVRGKITVSIRFTDSGQLQIQVQDNGVGISAENLTRIFSHGFTTRKDGHGFGLHSGAVAVQEMGGALTAQSDGPGKGATFTLELPIKAPAAVPAPEVSEPEPVLS